MIYKLNDKYYVKISGYLIEVIPFLKNDEVDFKTTQNKIEIKSDLVYKSIKIDDIKNELNKVTFNKNIELKPKKLSERTHNKFKFN